MLNKLDARAGVIRQIDALNHMTVAELRQKWNDLFGTDPSRFRKHYLIRRLAYRIQELAYGGLSEKARAQLRAIAANPKAAQITTGQLKPGTRLLRQWRGAEYEVVVGQDDFQYAGQSYSSLSAVARKITGRHCGGRRFFGLPPVRRAK